MLSIFGRRWSGSRCPLLPAAGSQCTAVKLPIINILSIWSVSMTCVTWLVDFELLVGVTWAPAVPGTKYCPPLGMPGTQTVGVTHNCSWGDIPPSSLVIRALHIQYTRLTRSMQQCKTMWLRSDYCDHGRSRFRLRGNPSNPPPIWLRACYFCTCLFPW